MSEVFELLAAAPHRRCRHIILGRCGAQK